MLINHDTTFLHLPDAFLEPLPLLPVPSFDDRLTTWTIVDDTTLH